MRLINLVREPKLIKLLEQDKPEKVGLEIQLPLDKSKSYNIKCIRYTDKLRMVIMRDVSRLLTVNKMRKDFVANVSHELKTPLTVFKGYIELIQNSSMVEENQQLKKAIEQMANQNERMENIVHDLLYLSKLEDDRENEHHEPINIVELISTIVESLQPLIKQKQHTVHLELTSNTQLQGQRTELESAFSNLIQNAIHYTQINGVIKVTWKDNEQGAIFEVSDNGNGIDASHINRLTERFYRVDTDRSREKGGTGLGLAIVKHVLQRHQADLVINSELGKGSQFSCQFSQKKFAPTDK